MRKFYSDIGSALEHVEVEENGHESVLGYLKMVKDTVGPHGARLVFIGNGGSAAIASHMAADYQKTAGLPSICFNDAAALTCISNDIGYASVFCNQLNHHGRFGDVLFAISSSGDSLSIVNAVNLAKDIKMNVVTLSGFDPSNRIRGAGGVNFYVPSRNYGVVEISHLAILHGLLNEVMQ